MFEYFLSLVILSFVIAGLSATLKHSSLCSSFKEWWEEYWDEKFFFCRYDESFKSWFYLNIKKLTSCSLCHSFHLSNMLQWLFVPFLGLGLYISISFGIAFCSWYLVTSLEEKYSRMGKEI